MAEKNADRDFRLLVLLILAASILAGNLAASWFSSRSKQEVATYYYVPAAKGRGEVIRGSQPQDPGELPRGAFAITPDLPCGKLPAEISWLFHLPLPINQADQESLMLLPRIGPVLAQRIIAFRET
ncbi:helix-hairpin-helix domain-containing protein, partial [Desulfobulbus sp. TB]|nr:helix-hairpin-helix domain-containing protein [Desulfobulbus sp. TB]